MRICNLWMHNFQCVRGTWVKPATPNCLHSSCLKTKHKFSAFLIHSRLPHVTRKCVFFIFNPQPCLCLCLCVCIYMCVFSSKVFQTVLPPCWQAIAMQARIQTHSNMPGSWPQGQCSCLAHNSDWLEYQWWELNPKQLLTRDIKQSGEFSCGDLIMPPGKHVLAHKVALFNTTASKQLITLSKRLQGGLHCFTPQSCKRKLRNKWSSSMITL